MGLTNWDEKVEYLRRTGKRGPHNPDYLHFLVRDVWGLDRPCSVVDLGCGIGAQGLWLLPLLAEVHGQVDSDPALAEFRDDPDLDRVVKLLTTEWDQRMARDSAGALAWQLFMHYFAQGTVKDDISLAYDVARPESDRLEPPALPSGVLQYHVRQQGDRFDVAARPAEVAYGLDGHAAMAQVRVENRTGLERRDYRRPDIGRIEVIARHHQPRRRLP